MNIDVLDQRLLPRQLVFQLGDLVVFRELEFAELPGQQSNLVLLLLDRHFELLDHFALSEGSQLPGLQACILLL